jgi:hypothetical protein
MSKSYFNLREALEIGTNKIVDEYKKATPGQVAEAPEDDMPASPDEAGMAMDQAKFIGYVAEEIMEYIEGNNAFPEWMQNKLSALHEKAKGMHAVMAGKYESVQEAKFTDKQIKMAYGIANDKRYKGGNYTGAVNAIEKIAKGLSDHPDVKKVLKVTNESLRSGVNEANYQVKAGKHAIGSASYDDKEIVTVTPQQAKKLTAYFQKNKDGDMWKKLFQGGGRGGKGAENQKDFDSMVAGLKESTELDEAAYKVPNNYAAMKARMNKNKKATDAQINKVLGPTKNAQQGVEALKKAFKVTDDEAKAMIGRVMPTEANRGSDSYRVKYKGDINTVRADSPEDALKKSMKAFGIGSMNKSDYMKNASAISEAIDMSKAGEYARVMNPKTREIKKVLKTDLKKYVDKGWTHMTQLKNRLTKEVSEAVNFHVRMDHLKDQESKLVVAILQKAEKSGSIKYKGESDKGILFSAKSEPAVNTVTKDIAKVSRVADVEIMEKLEVSDGLGAWIKDFQASDSPQFADKDDEEIRNMAIAAYLAAKREAKKGGDTSESSKAYGKTMSKQRDDKKKAGITDKDKQTLGKLADLMKREKR